MKKLGTTTIIDLAQQFHYGRRESGCPFIMQNVRQSILLRRRKTSGTSRCHLASSEAEGERQKQQFERMRTGRQQHDAKILDQLHHNVLSDENKRHLDYLTKQMAMEKKQRAQQNLQEDREALESALLQERAMEEKENEREVARRERLRGVMYENMQIEHDKHLNAKVEAARLVRFEREMLETQEFDRKFGTSIR